MSLAPLIHLPAMPAVLVIGFSVLLVVSLVVAEEAELRRDPLPGAAEG